MHYSVSTTGLSVKSGPCFTSGPQIIICSGVWGNVVFAGAALLHTLFPHSWGLVVAAREWSPLKQVSLLPEWLSEGVFIHIDFMSVTLSLTSGALYVCHCCWPAVAMKVKRQGKMFLCSYVTFQVGYFSRVVETLCKNIRVASISLYNTSRFVNMFFSSF